MLGRMARKPRHGNDDRALYYRTAEVASVLDISTRTLFRKLKSGEFPEPKRDPVNNYRVWTISEIEQLERLMKG
jgi:predicted DNA-binding transcriptional regulator AlpA